MPRRPRRATGQFVFHVFNRAIQAVDLFEEPADYHAFVRILKEVAEHQVPMRLLAYVIMPNHWHLVLWPPGDGSLSRFMQRLTSTHVRRWRDRRGSRGRGALYQGRFKAVAVQRDDHLLRICRYVERNPLRARLVARAEQWCWSSASTSAPDDDRPVLTIWPIPKPIDWLDSLNLPEPPRVLGEVRRAIHRGTPYGGVAWRARVIKELTWPAGVRRPGRPHRTPRGRD